MKDSRRVTYPIQLKTSEINAWIETDIPKKTRVFAATSVSSKRDPIIATIHGINPIPLIAR